MRVLYDRVAAIDVHKDMAAPREAPCCIPGSAGRNSEDIPGSDGLPGAERRREQ